MNKYKDIIGRINYGMFAVLVFLLPFPQVFLRYAIVLWLISWFLEGRWLQKPMPLKSNKMLIPFVLFALWYGWRIVSGLWAADHAAWAWQMERYMTFALLVPVGLWGVNERYDWKQLGRVLTIGCVTALPIYVIILLTLYHHPVIIDRLNWVADWNFDLHRWNLFIEDNVSILKHRLFLCSVEILGAFVALQVWKEKKWVLACMLPVMLATIPLTGSRQSILTLAAMAVVGVIYLLPQRYRIRYGLGIILLGIVLGSAVLKFHPRMQNFDVKDIKEMRTISPEHDVRFNLWGIALQRPSDYVWYGLGAGQSTNYMLARYQEMGWDYYYEKEYNTHNQYLAELMEIGLFGLLFFVLAWLSIPLCAKNKGRITALLFTTLYLFNMCTDCMFGRFDGIVLWAVFLVIILLQSDTEGEEQTTRNT